MNHDPTQPVRLTIMAPSTADQKLEMTNPSKNEATRPSIAALMTSRKSPSVRIVIGRVRITIRGRTREHAKSWGADGVRLLGSGLTGRGWAGAETGVAGEAGCGGAARRDERGRGCSHWAWRGGGLGRPWAQARRSEADHSGAPGRDSFGAADRRGRATPGVRRLGTSAGQQG